VTLNHGFLIYSRVQSQTQGEGLEYKQQELTRLTHQQSELEKQRDLTKEATNQKLRKLETYRKLKEGKLTDEEEKIIEMKSKIILEMKSKIIEMKSKIIELKSEMQGFEKGIEELENEIKELKVRSLPFYLWRSLEGSVTDTGARTLT
jgi:uncharacterized protein involved in exopolysaccharide biosynthesis